MRYIRYAFLGVLGIVLISVSLANRDFVTLRLMPDDLATLVGFNMAVSLPLFVVVLGGIVAGLIIGFVWEWMREFRIRREADAKRREVRKLEREVSRLKQKETQGRDDVLVILDEAS